MGDEDNSDLILQAVLSTHQQQLQTLRQRRLALLRITSLNIILLSIFVGFAGVAVQAQLPIGPIQLVLPVAVVVAAIVVPVVKFKDFGVHWGYALDREVAAEMNNVPNEVAFQELVWVYQQASEKNKKEIQAIDKWILIVIFLMCISLGSLLALILAFG